MVGKAALSLSETLTELAFLAMIWFLLPDPIRSFNHVAVTGTATAAPAKRVDAGSSPARNSNQPKPGWQMRSLHPTENREEHARYVPQAPFFEDMGTAQGCR